MDYASSFIHTYLERDIPALGPRIPAETLRRLWTMLAHEQGAQLNMARLAASLGTSGGTVNRYVDLMADLLLVRRLQPLLGNHGKRLTRSPKVYLRDSGIVHALLGVVSLDDVLGHPVAGGSREGFVLDNLIAAAPAGAQPWFYRTSAGAEIDLVLELSSTQRWAVEIKRSSAPAMSRGFHQSCKDIDATTAIAIYPGHETYNLGAGVTAMSIQSAIQRLRNLEHA